MKDLHKKIIAIFDDNSLSKAGVPENEITNYKKFKVVPIDLLVKANKNYKDYDKALSESLRNNIKRIGQVENIIIRLLETGYYEVVNGNHRLDELVALNKKFVVCFDCGKVSWQEAIRIAIETNETQFKSDHIKLSEFVKEAVDAFGKGELQETMPYTSLEIDDFLNIADFDWDSSDKPKNDYSILEDEALDGEAEGYSKGVRKSIQIDFNSEDFEKAKELVSRFRIQKIYIGGLIIEKLEDERQRL